MVSTLPASHRVRQKADFDQVFQRRNRLYGRHFLAYYRNNQLSHPRIGVIASKRNLSLAVDRNRVRRILREQFRLKQHELLDYDIVFIVKNGSGNIDNKELRRCCDNILKQLIELRRKS